MDTTAHLSTPNDDSLASKVAYYQSTAASLQQVRASIEHLNNTEWAARLGDRQEVEEAEQIIARSHRLAMAAISSGDYHTIMDLGLMDQQEIRQLERLKRQNEMQIMRDKEHQRKASHQHSHRR